MDVIKTFVVDDPIPSPALNLPKLPTNDIYQYHAMVKPSGAQCNLDCTYCFYLHKQDLLQQSKHPRLNLSLLELHIKQYIEAQTGPSVDFTWQGGEPTLMGVRFFEIIIELQNKYKKTNQLILNDLQTNGTLLNDEWCQFLKKHNFLVGLSLDGPKELHDQYRYSKTKKGTFERVVAAANLLKKYSIEFNVLCVVNRSNAKHPLTVYRFIRDQIKPRVIQFIPLVEPKDFEISAPVHTPNTANLYSPDDERADSVVTNWSVLPKDWGTFLTTIWDEWIQRDFGDVFVDQFENIISMMFGYGPQKCVNGEICGKAIAIEHNGDVYSCDHFVYPAYKLGNIKDVHQGDLVFSEKQKQFAHAKSDTLPTECKSCQFLKVCWGECPKNRLYKTKDGEPGLNYLCSGLKIFYTKAFLDYPHLKRRLTI